MTWHTGSPPLTGRLTTGAGRSASVRGTFLLRGTSVPLACFLICQHPYQQHPQTRPDPRPRGWQDVSCNACIPEDLHRPLSERTKAGVSVLKSQGELPGPVTVASGGRTYPVLTRSGDSGNRADTWSKKYRRPGKRVCNHLVGRQQGSREAHHSPAQAGSRERQSKREREHAISLVSSYKDTTLMMRALLS